MRVKIPKAAWTILSLALQMIFFCIVVWKVSEYSLTIYLTLEIISVITAIGVVCSNSNPAFKISWVFLIIALPIFGWLLYLMWGNKVMGRRQKARINEQLKKSIPLLPENKATKELLSEYSPIYYRQSQLLTLSTGFSPSATTSSSYYSPIETGFGHLLGVLRSAEKYIFIETFILAEGSMWDEIHKILKQKAENGVEVKIIYDDFGTGDRIKKDFTEKLKTENIMAVSFNKFIPVLNSFMNCRDHRKIFVVDGKFAVTGGANIADEYVNRQKRFGEWKDSMVIMEGPVAASFAQMFISFFNAITHQTHDIKAYIDRYDERLDLDTFSAEFVQGYCDSPLSNLTPAKGIYLKMINNATDYILITTPYLIIDNEMSDALILAALSGVKVKILTPKIYDKWYVHTLTRSNYGILLKSGIEIYEYTPGFVHSKLMVCDDKVATVGTVNMDFRSFYLHFECGAYFCGGDTVLAVRDDINESLAVSEQITYDKWKHRSPAAKFWEIWLKLFEPLM